MKSKILGILVAFSMILGGIIAGYWDMLESERAELRTIAQRAFDRFSTSETEAEPTSSNEAEQSDTGNQPVADAGDTGELRTASNETAESAPAGDADEAAATGQVASDDEGKARSSASKANADDSDESVETAAATDASAQSADNAKTSPSKHAPDATAANGADAPSSTRETRDAEEVSESTTGTPEDRRSQSPGTEAEAETEAQTPDEVPVSEVTVNDPAETEPEAPTAPETAMPVAPEEPAGPLSSSENGTGTSSDRAEAAADTVTNQGNSSKTDEAKDDSVAEDAASPSSGATDTAAETGSDANLSSQAENTADAAEADDDVVMLPLTPSESGGAGAPENESLRFDVLRVEPDGSMVVAGKGPPNSVIYLEDGGEQLGSDTSGPGGDFVVVLSDGLEAGAHAIKLVAETEAGARSVSEETAIIDVPERGEEDQLLALVESPDEPSRLIDIPVAERAASAGETGEMSKDGSADAPKEDAAASGSNNDRQAAEVESGSERSKDAPDQADAPKSEPAAAPSGDDQTASSPGDAATRTADSQETANDSSGNASDVVYLPRDETAPAPTAADNASTNLRVEAIEIEGERIFIAGAAPTGSNIRVYLDNDLLAETRSGGTGRFLIEAASSIAVGDHIVRVDQIGGNGDVTARVAVPFVRPDTGSMSAVSPSVGISEADEPNATSEPSEGPVGTGATDGSSKNAGSDEAQGEAASPESGSSAASSTATSGSSPTNAASAERASGISDDSPRPQGKSPDAGAVSTRGAPSAGIGANNAAADAQNDDRNTTDIPAEADQPADGPNDGAPAASIRNTQDEMPRSDMSTDAERAGNTTVDARGRPTSTGDRDEPAPSSNDASGSMDEPERSPGSESDAEDNASEAATAPSTEESASANRQASATGANQNESAGGDSTAATSAREDDRRQDYSVPTRIQAPLESRAGRVLIRKGDTLWRISRENYGEGMRYTVIYLANGDQIRDPDLIYPGQIFRMPSKANSEEPSSPKNVK